MLKLLDASLERYLRTIVPLPERDVAVEFEAPDREWGQSVTRPTINLYLWDIRRNLSEAQSGAVVYRTEDDDHRRRPAKPRIDCRYLISAWTTDVQDEHDLLGLVLTALLPEVEIGPDHLEGRYADVRPVPTIKLASAGDDDKSDFWSALGGQLKPGLDLLVTATVDSFVDQPAGPPVDRFRIDLSDRQERPISERRSAGGRAPGHDGALVSTRRGNARVSAGGKSGAFLVPGESGDDVAIDDDGDVTWSSIPDEGPLEP